MVPLAGRRLAKDLVADGLTLPAGTDVTPAIWLTHTRADLYPEPFAFRPERFLEDGPDTYAWIPFGGGIRRCIGAAFAEFEMRIVLREVLTRCELHKASPAPEKIGRRNITLSPKDGTPVVVTARHPARERDLVAACSPRDGSTTAPYDGGMAERHRSRSADVLAAPVCAACARRPAEGTTSRSPRGLGDLLRADVEAAPGVSGRSLLRSLARSPAAAICGAPFAGFGSRLVRPLGYRPSRKNPTLCATCVEASPPGGMTTEAGVLFADLRGFTSLSEQLRARGGQRPAAPLLRLRRGRPLPRGGDRQADRRRGDGALPADVPVARRCRAGRCWSSARELLRRIGYGSAEGPFAEVGIGLDYGEAFVGNVGRRSLNDFTAVGDVVNVAARLQGEAKGGEIVASGRLASGSAEPPGERLELTLKGKAEPVVAYRSGLE